MSSSPIRHEPPGSSPFKAEPSSSQVHALRGIARGIHGGGYEPGSSQTIRAGGDGNEMEEMDQDGEDDDEMVDTMEWDKDELDREWGEYRGANSVLYDLVSRRYPFFLCLLHLPFMAHEYTA